MTATQDPLFTPRPPRAKKPDNPAYRPSRQNAEQHRDELLAEWRAHRAGCERCATAAARADATGRRPADEVCGSGLAPVMQAARIQRAIIRGYYPDRGKPATTSPGQAGRNTQEALWTP